jgi:hypothetical protein
MVEIIRGEVVKIVDKIRVALNVGSDKGVSKGMKFVIYVEGEELQDSGGNKLGKLEIPKAELEIIDVQPLISIAISSSTKTVTENPMNYLLYPFQGSYTREVRSSLPLDPSTELMKIDMNVKVGDKVRSVK